MIVSVTLNPCVDHTVFVSGLKPHDTNKVLRTETDAGGKGVNLSRIVAELGGETVATGYLGGDSGRFVSAVLERQGVGNDFVSVWGETRTNFSVESGDGPPTTFNARGASVTGLDWENLLAHVSGLARRARWVALGGSLPPGVPESAYAVLGSLARDCGAHWALDADGTSFAEGVKAGPDMVKPNRDEAERFLGTSITGVASAVDAAKRLGDVLAREGSKLCLAAVSLGDRGAALSTPQGTFYGQAPQVEARSTIGSGDSFLGAFLLTLAKGGGTSEALRDGIGAGAATALTDGTRIGSRDDAVRLSSLVRVWAEEGLRSWPPADLAGWPSDRPGPHT